MAELAQRRYPNNFDIQAAELWVRNIVLKGPMVFLPIRTDDAFCISMITLTPWFPNDWEAVVVMICADDGKMWQALALLRESLAWAGRRNCADWRLSSETSYDIEPLARRLGAEEFQPRYHIRLRP